MEKQVDSFVPALGLSWLTPAYDLVAWLLGEQSIKRHCIARAGLQPGHRVLDLGCGTGTLAILIKQLHPGAQVSGLDIDPRMLAIAQRKVDQAGLQIELSQGSATSPPYRMASFDRILTTLVLHHLTTPQKVEVFGATRGLLAPGGEIHIADWGKPHNLWMEIAALGFRAVDGNDATAANLRGELPAMLREAGFVDVREEDRRSTLFGTLTYLQGRCPG